MTKQLMLKLTFYNKQRLDFRIIQSNSNKYKGYKLIMIIIYVFNHLKMLNIKDKFLISFNNNNKNNNFFNKVINKMLFN